jgi:hypothetical protein
MKRARRKMRATVTKEQLEWSIDGLMAQARLRTIKIHQRERRGCLSTRRTDRGKKG